MRCVALNSLKLVEPCGEEAAVSVSETPYCLSGLKIGVSGRISYHVRSADGQVEVRRDLETMCSEVIRKPFFNRIHTASAS